jgi:transposase
MGQVRSRDRRSQAAWSTSAQGRPAHDRSDHLAADNGAKWRSIPAELGNWHHAYLRFRRWAVNGVWDKIMAHVVAKGEPKLAFACIDGTVARAHQKAAGARPSKPIR